MALTEIPIELSSTPGIVDNSTSTAITIDSSNNTNFADNAKAIFGTGSDLQIYSDGATSYIKESGSSDLKVQADDFYVFNAAGNSVMISALDTDKVGLGFAGVEKFKTTSSGISVTGTVTADGLTVDGGGSFTMTGGGLKVFNNGTAGYNANIFFGLPNQTDGWSIGQGITANDGVFRLYDNGGAGVKMSATTGGDISFYEDTGTTPKLVWDASAESLGIGTSSPAASLQVGDGTDTVNWLRLTGTVSDLYIGQNPANDSFDQTNAAKILSVASYPLAMGTANAYPVIFGTNDIEAMRIDASGNLLVGTTDEATYNLTSGGGTALWENGLVSAAKSGAIVGIFNRTSSDGDILQFRKDGTAVGSINAAFSDLAIGNGDTGLHFNSGSEQINPWNMSTNLARDNAIDLGASGARFNDLHLGGTAHANGGLIGLSSQLGSAIFTVHSNNAQGLAIGFGSGTNEYRRLYHDVTGLYFESSTNQAYLNSSGAWINASDVTLKKDIEDIDYGIETVKNLKPRKYKMKSDNEAQIGFIAQELAEQVPEIVGGKEGLLGVSYGQLTAVLTKAIQEQQATIEALTARIAALES